MTQADSVHSTPHTNTSADTPASDSGSPQDSLYLPTDTTPEQLFRAIGKLRKDARDEIDRLIRFLDYPENHMAIDCEPDADEDGGDDGDGDIDEDSDPAEPALGSLDGQTDQRSWAAGGRGDLELDPAESGIVDLDGLLEQIGCGGFAGPRTRMGR